MNEPLLGHTIVLLRQRGAKADGPHWILNGSRIRVLRAANQMLHDMEAAFVREVAPTVAADIIIAVGSETLGLPANIVRGNTDATIARGTSSRWLTRAQAVEELSLC